MATISAGYVFGSTELVTNTKLANFINNAVITDSNIVTYDDTVVSVDGNVVTY
jgi:hypothetical protein